MRSLALVLVVVLGFAFVPVPAAAQETAATPTATPADAVVAALIGREWRGAADGYGASGALDARPVRLEFASHEGRVVSGTQDVTQPDGSVAAERIEAAVLADGLIAGSTTDGLLFGELRGTTLVVVLARSGPGHAVLRARLRADALPGDPPVADPVAPDGRWRGPAAGVAGGVAVSGGSARLDVTASSGGAFRAALAYEPPPGGGPARTLPVEGAVLPGGMVAVADERGYLLGRLAGTGDLVLADLGAGAEPAALRLDLAPEGVPAAMPAAAPGLAGRWVGPAIAASGGVVEAGVDEFVVDSVGPGAGTVTHRWQGEDGSWNDAAPLAAVALDDTSAAMVDDTAWHLARLLPDGRLEIVKLLPRAAAPESVLIDARRQP